MILERVTQIELSDYEQLKVTFDYLKNRKEDRAKSLDYWQTTPHFKKSITERNLKSEISALDAVIKILEHEIKIYESCIEEE